MVRVAINGFGRIGRLAFRVGLLRHLKEMELAAINTSGSMEVEGWAHLTNYDTTYREFRYKVGSLKVRSVKEATDKDPLIGYLTVEELGLKVPVLAQRDPEKIPWAEYGVDVVIESTGHFATEEGALKHAMAGARRVVISAPVKGGNVPTYVLGVNEPQSLASGWPVVISNASCTTNNASPVAAVMVENFGIMKALMTTVHAYTDDQNLQDGSHKDLRRARAAAVNIVPTTTGAAAATTETIPALKGLFDGVSLRVPVVTGSISDFVFVTRRQVTVEEVNGAFVRAAATPAYKRVLRTTSEPLVSSDVVGSDFSAIVDLTFTQVVGGDLVKVLAWYDNEWGYTNRLVEQVIRVGESVETRALTDPITEKFLVKADH